MSSLLTNASAMTALQTLSLTNKNLATTQNRIATGERVSQASDNAAYWSIATGMKAQNSVNQAVKDSLGFGQAVVDTAYTAMNEAIKLTEQVLSKTVSLEQGGIDATAVQAEIDELINQIGAIAGAADFEGINLLQGAFTAGPPATYATPDDLTVVSGYTKGSGEVSTIAVAAYDMRAAITTLTTAPTAPATAAGNVEGVLDAMRAAAATMGASKMRIDSQMEFTSKLMDAVDRGIGVLVDADMNAESARLAALQTQQQLGIQALSIANQNSQSILSLFR